MWRQQSSKPSLFLECLPCPCARFFLRINLKIDHKDLPNFIPDCSKIQAKMVLICERNLFQKMTLKFSKNHTKKKQNGAKSIRKLTKRDHGSSAISRQGWEHIPRLISLCSKIEAKVAPKWLQKGNESVVRKLAKRDYSHCFSTNSRQGYDHIQRVSVLCFQRGSHTQG